MNINNNQKIST